MSLKTFAIASVVALAGASVFNTLHIVMLSDQIHELQLEVIRLQDYQTKP